MLIKARATLPKKRMAKRQRTSPRVAKLEEVDLDLDLDEGNLELPAAPELRSLSEAEVNAFRSYLLNPTSAGIWELEGSWIKESELSSAILRHAVERASSLKTWRAAGIKKNAIFHYDTDFEPQAREMIQDRLSFWPLLFWSLSLSKKENHCRINEEYAEFSRTISVCDPSTLIGLTAEAFRVYEQYFHHDGVQAAVPLGMKRLGRYTRSLRIRCGGILNWIQSIGKCPRLRLSLN